MSAALERQIRPIYDALDSNSNKSAVQACNKILRKHPDLELVKALKALAFVRMNKIEESLPLCDEVLAAKPADLDTLNAMMHVLRALGRHTDLVTMYDDAYKRNPNNEELGGQDFFANVRTGNWKSAQQIATRLHKSFKAERYLYWAVLATLLQAREQGTSPDVAQLLYRLASRLLASATLPPHASADRLYVHLAVHKALGAYTEARALFNSEQAQAHAKTSLALDELRREVVKGSGGYIREGERAKARIHDENDRNWLEFLSLIDAAFYEPSTEGKGVSTPEQASEDLPKDDVTTRVSATRDFLRQLASQDGRRERSPFLALLELEKRARTYGKDVALPFIDGEKGYLSLLKNYLSLFGEKACCVEDLKPYLELEGSELAQWNTFLDDQALAVNDTQSLLRTITILKLKRFCLPASSLDIDAEQERAKTYIRLYFSTLPLGANLPTTELQPADDLLLLFAQTAISIWASDRNESYLHAAIVALEFGSLKSKHSYLIRLHLVRLYRLLGSAYHSLHHYRALNVKQVQNDTLSHFLLARASTFSLAASGDLTFTQECVEASHIYITNTIETSESVVRAFSQEKYSQIPDFITFEDRLDNSLQRDLVKLEHVRMRLSHEGPSMEIVDSELIELKFIFDRRHHDNRDFDILPNYQPRCALSTNEQTLMLGSSPGLGWLVSFLRIYIRVFLLASDIDDTVESALLIGDRPTKLSEDAETDLPFTQRLQKRKDEELAELTEAERALYEWTVKLCDWLQPYHDHARPSPEAVLSEATRQTELRAGKAAARAFYQSGVSEGVGAATASTLTSGGTAAAAAAAGGKSKANGHGQTNGTAQKKAEEPPAVAEQSPEIEGFFDDMASRFRAATNGQVSVVDALHIATLVQEAMLLFSLVTLRFKNAAVVKTHKFGLLTQYFKNIRTKGVAVLRQISQDLSKYGAIEGTMEARKAFVSSCTLLEDSPEIEHDFKVDIAKKVTDGRKRVLENVAKGAQKLSLHHFQ